MEEIKYKATEHQHNFEMELEFRNYSFVVFSRKDKLDFWEKEIAC